MIAVTAVKIIDDEAEPEVVYDMLVKSPEDELWRVMYQVWPDQIVFLPLDNALFGSGTIPMNFEGTIYWGSPKMHYDAFILLPLAHRSP